MSCSSANKITVVKRHHYICESEDTNCKRGLHWKKYTAWKKHCLDSVTPSQSHTSGFQAVQSGGKIYYESPVLVEQPDNRWNVVPMKKSFWIHTENMSWLKNMSVPCSPDPLKSSLWSFLMLRIYNSRHLQDSTKALWSLLIIPHDCKYLILDKKLTIRTCVFLIGICTQY